MPTLRTLDGALVTLGDGPRAILQRPDLTRDRELGGTDTRDLILSCPPLQDIPLGIVTTRLVEPFLAALHAAIDAGTSSEIIDAASILCAVAKAEAV